MLTQKKAIAGNVEIHEKSGMAGNGWKAEAACIIDLIFRDHDLDQELHHTGEQKKEKP